MFEDTLLIIKSDYLHKRKPLLLHLLSKHYQIQGQRKVQFSPEQAAEFYQELSEDKCFMLQVILLSKGHSEAFILTKENAVADLLNVMVCYFVTSIEMESKVHVTKSPSHVSREIRYIFPNYIHEPIKPFYREKFVINDMMAPLVGELYELTHSGDDDKHSWKVKLANWLTLNNRDLPRITAQCLPQPNFELEEQEQRTIPSRKKEPWPRMQSRSSHSSPMILSSSNSSMVMTTSSCMTCTCFDGTDVCLQHESKIKKIDKHDEIIAHRNQKLLSPPKTESSEEEPELNIDEELEEFEEYTVVQQPKTSKESLTKDPQIQSDDRAQTLEEITVRPAEKSDEKSMEKSIENDDINIELPDAEAAAAKKESKSKEIGTDVKEEAEVEIEEKTVA